MPETPPPDYWPQIITGIFTLAAGFGVALFSWKREKTHREEDRKARLQERDEERRRQLVDLTLTTVGAATSLIFEMQMSISNGTPSVEVLENRSKAVRTNLIRLHAAHPDAGITRMLTELENALTWAMFTLIAWRSQEGTSSKHESEAKLRAASKTADDIIERMRSIEGLPHVGRLGVDYGSS